MINLGDDPIIAAEQVISGFDGVTVLDGVTMSAQEHHITVILGSSGCGKTTLLKHFIRLHTPWSGSLKMFGHEIVGMDDPEFNRMLLKVGVLFQNGALLNSITVTENVAIPLEQHTVLPRRLVDQLVRVKLNLVGLSNAGRKLPSELSGGMRKRAALARAIALDPPLLFCDEPSAGLDPVTSAALDDLILKMRDELGMSVVIVSHELASILRIADSVVFMDAGKVLFCGPLPEARSAGIEQIDLFFESGAIE